MLVTLLVTCTHSVCFTTVTQFWQCGFRKDLFNLGFMARQNCFTHFEPSQSVGGAKTGDPREKPPDHPPAFRLEVTAVRRQIDLER